MTETNGAKRFTQWFQELAKICGGLLVIGTIGYFVLGLRFVTRTDYNKHLEWAVNKTITTDVLEAKLVQTNEGILKNLEMLNENIAKLNDRMARVETKLEIRH